MAAPTLPEVELIVCADWSSLPRGRSAWAVDVGERAIFPMHRRDRAWTLVAVLEEAAALGGGERVLVSVDAPIGVPRSFLRHTDAASFVEWLLRRPNAALTDEPVRDPTAWSIDRPFFRVQKGPGGLTRFIDAASTLGVRLWRDIDTRTHAKSMFAFGLPGQVAPAARALWTEIAEARASGLEFTIWPFEQPRTELTVAEIYPRAAYGIALASRTVAKVDPVAEGAMLGL
jgi:hypothetical protein